MFGVDLRCSDQPTKITPMFKNNFRIALRNLWRNRAFSIINISGLAIGIATCLIITLFMIDELSYDRYTDRSDFMVPAKSREAV